MVRKTIIIFAVVFGVIFIVQRKDQIKKWFSGNTNSSVSQAAATINNEVTAALQTPELQLSAYQKCLKNSLGGQGVPSQSEIETALNKCEYLKQA